MGTAFMTVQQAADVLQVSRYSIYRLIWSGQVQSVTIGRSRRIIRQSFDTYVSDLIDQAA
ncbi:helix-turn-helix domain-containing protein [Nocardia puris]|uniref:Excisionase family DNA binding protein n=1 Tax=Nocardia puris TaxID=208602 RepID=A0A366E3X3_9NOCA|nr:helix-turn-helix domain-containing protein [Nocardia puris]MBF6368907.1 helix-turn-helix domain-containing protein [Nocardia puris]RBO97071.1 excisionase family DNA binding protein [Nocardia puris]